MLKKIMLILLSIQIAIMPTLIFAFAPNTDTKPTYPPGTGEIKDPPKFPNKRPSAGAVAKVLKVGNAIALGQAVADILGDGVDWLLDPDNNQIKYKPTKTTTTDSTLVYYYYVPNSHIKDNWLQISATEACTKYKSMQTSHSNNYYWANSILSNIVDNATSITCVYTGKISETANETESEQVFQKVEPEDKQQTRTLSLEKVAEKVLENADKGHQPSIAAANQAIKEESANSNPKEDPNASTNPKEDPNASTNPNEKKEPKKEPEPFELPEFCSWASTVCDFIDWVKEEPDKPKDEKDKDLEIEEKDMIDPSNFDRDYLSYGGQCPVFSSFTVNVGSQSVNLSFDITPLCDFVVQVRPAVIALAYLAGMGIVANAIREI